jgi:type IV pilus assembly protein PilM
VEARGSGSGIQITGLGIENTPPGAIQGGIVADPKALGAAVRTLLSRSGVGAKRTVSAAAGAASVVVRVIEVPRMTPSELAETMKWEVERHIPFAANDVEMSYQPIVDPAMPDDPNNPNMEVLLAVAQRDMVGTHIETLQAAGLNPVAIDVEPLATGRSLVNLSPQGLATKNVVIVNIGAVNTDVGVFKNGLLRFPRTIPLAGDNFTRAIADHLGLPLDQAEDEKRANAVIFLDAVSGGAEFGGDDADSAASGTPFDMPFSSPFSEGAAASDPTPFATPASPSPFEVSDTPAASSFDLTDAAPPAAPAISAAADDPFAVPPAPATADDPFAAPAGPLVPGAADPAARRQRDVFDAILPILGEFVTELRRSIDYFRSRYPNEMVDQIILCGGSARIQNLDQFIQSDLGVPTVVADPFAGVTVASKQMAADRVRELAPSFAVAVGLATRDALMGSEKS